MQRQARSFLLAALFLLFLGQSNPGVELLLASKIGLVDDQQDYTVCGNPAKNAMIGAATSTLALGSSSTVRKQLMTHATAR